MLRILGMCEERMFAEIDTNKRNVLHGGPIRKMNVAPLQGERHRFAVLMLTE